VYETSFLAEKLISWRQKTQNGKSEGLDFNSLKFKTNDPAPPYNIYSQDQAVNERNSDLVMLTTLLLNKDAEGKI